MFETQLSWEARADVGTPALLFFIPNTECQVQEVVGKGKEGRRTWHVLGCKMSPKCVTAVLGLGNARMMRALSGRVDRRLRVWGGAPRFIWKRFRWEAGVSYWFVWILL